MTIKDTQKEFAYSREDFERVRQRLLTLAGIKLADSKDAMVYSRLVRRLRTLGLDSFDSYLKYLKKTPAEEQLFINALTTNLTAFFRESHHFTALTEYLRQNRRVKTIWCAASSTGEEPYSIAMTVAQALGTFTPGISIVASDIDSSVLAKARTGIYNSDAVAKLPLDICKQFFHRGKGKHADKVKVVDEIRKMVQFRQINLLADNWPVRGPIDILFCRNVMIYFDRATQLKILQKMVALMPPESRYFAGHSENFGHASSLITPLGQTIYRPAYGIRNAF